MPFNKGILLETHPKTKIKKKKKLKQRNSLQYNYSLLFRVKKNPNSKCLIRHYD